jgi:redox-sensitive bicupin YhaK (pirin superfamily)
MLDKQDGEPAGGPHPHAGFETVSLLLEGEIGDARHMMQGGDMQLMTAGSGIIHSETIDTKKKMRLLQLWLSLPKKDRWVQPRVQDIALQKAPLYEGDGTKIRVYSGSFAGVVSPVSNYTPIIIADIQLAGGSTTTQQLSSSYNTFLYVIDGTLNVGEEGKSLSESQVGWLDKDDEDAMSELILSAGPAGSRAILYAGLPTKDQIVPYGPFIGNTEEDIRRLYKEYREDKMQHISSVPESQIIVL